MSKPQKFIVTKQNNFRTGTVLTGRVEKTLFAGGPCLVVHTSNGVRWNLGLLTERLSNLSKIAAATMTEKTRLPHKKL